MAQLTIIPTGGALGAVVHQLDLRHPLDTAAVVQLQRAFQDYALLLFRNQQLSKADQVRFSGYFGDPVPTRQICATVTPIAPKSRLFPTSKKMAKRSARWAMTKSISMPIWSFCTRPVRLRCSTASKRQTRGVIRFGVTAMQGMTP